MIKENEKNENDNKLLKKNLYGDDPNQIENSKDFENKYNISHRFLEKFLYKLFRTNKGM